LKLRIKGFTLIELMIVIAIIAIIAAIAIPNLLEARKNGNETAAIGAMKTVGAAQALFREGDKENDGNLDYGSLIELSTAGASGGLIDAVLGSGSKQGYLFTAEYSATTSEFLWHCIATPSVPGTTGDRYFVTNHQGVTYFTTSTPFIINSTDCTINAAAKPVGR
jgi:type IV pilus assembly protein PilA